VSKAKLSVAWQFPVLRDSKYSQGSTNPEEGDAREDETEVHHVSFSEATGTNEFQGASSAIRSYSEVVSGKKGK
jgi:hypothetical protein